MDPRHDPRITHLWQEHFPQTLCGILQDDYPDEDPFRNMRAGNRVYLCYGCLTIKTGRTPTPPPEWFARHA